MATQKWFKVQYSVDFSIDASLLIMDLPGYSHIQFQSQKAVYGAGCHYQTETAFVRSHSLTSLRKELKSVFGYNFEKYLYNRIQAV